MGRFLGGSSGRERCRESRDYGIARTGHIRYFIGTEDGDVDRLVTIREGGHAIAASGNYERLQFHPRHQLLAGSDDLRPILTNFHVQTLFDFRLVRRGCGDAGVFKHAEAGIERDWHPAQAPFGADRVQDRRCRRPIAVVGHQQSIRGTRILPRRQHQLTREVRVGRCFRFAIYTHDLLAGGVRHAGQDARLGHSGVPFVFEHTAHRNVLVTERFDQQAAWLVIANYTDGQDIDIEGGQIAHGIRAAAWNQRSLAVLQDQDRSFARDTGDFTVDEFVGNQVAQNCDRSFGERLDDLLEAVGFFGVLGHSQWIVSESKILS